MYRVIIQDVRVQLALSYFFTLLVTKIQRCLFLLSYFLQTNMIHLDLALSKIVFC